MSETTQVIGHCNCGGISVTLKHSEVPVPVSLCHCLDCRASGGTLFAVNLIIPSSNVQIGGDVTPSVYSTKAASGNQANRHFCPRCGSPTHTTVTENPTITFVKGGLFRKSGYTLNAPFKEQWLRRAETWEHSYVSENRRMQ